MEMDFNIVHEWKGRLNRGNPAIYGGPQLNMGGFYV